MGPTIGYAAGSGNQEPDDAGRGITSLGNIGQVQLLKFNCDAMRFRSQTAVLGRDSRDSSSESSSLKFGFNSALIRRRS